MLMKSKATAEYWTENYWLLGKDIVLGRLNVINAPIVSGDSIILANKTICEDSKQK